MSRAAALPWMPILMYHSIVERETRADDEPEISVRRLRAHLALLLRLGFSAVPLDLALSPPAPAEGRRFAITFDDAYRDNLELALPVLESFCVPAIVFVPTAHVGGKAVWNRRPNLLASAAELRSLQRAGVLIGSHGRSHRPLTGLSDRELEQEVAGSKHELEDLLGEEVAFFSYPHHDVDRRVMAAAERAGYLAAVGGRWLPHETFHLERVDAWRLGQGGLALRAYGVYRWLRRQPLPSPFRSLLRKAA